MELSKTFTFEASHVLPGHKGKCSNLHGHSWKLTVTVKGPVDPETGMVMDFYDIKQAVQPIIDDLDHAHLGAWKTDKVIIQNVRVVESGCVKLSGTKWVSWLPDKQTGSTNDWSPTSENLILEIANQLVKHGCPFAYLELDETCTVQCGLSWEEFQRLQRGNAF